MTNVLFIFGTRPEAIKLAPVILAMKAKPDLFKVRICATAQHREMLDHVLNLFGIHPDYDLNLMKKNQSLCSLTALIIQALDRVIAKEKPDWILVQGDTTSAMVASLAGFYHRVRIAHVEAGLRSNNKYHPYPEEINRKLVSVIADIHFAPTQNARDNLLVEGISSSKIIITGNTVVDAMNLALEKKKDTACEFIDSIPSDKKILLVTAHRRENFGKYLSQICNALRRISLENGHNLNIVYPIHLNPSIKLPVEKALSQIPNIFLVPPLEYLSFLRLMQRAYLLLTDSGGLQEEAPSLGKPVLIMRQTTERPEAIEAGTAKLIGTDENRIVEEVMALINNTARYKKMTGEKNPFGDGDSAEKICKFFDSGF